MSNVINTSLQYRKFSIQTYIKNESIQKLSLKLCNKGLMNKSYRIQVQLGQVWVKFGLETYWSKTYYCFF